MYNRLLSFVTKHPLLYQYQFGFRCGHSLELALTCLVDTISNALENDEYVLEYSLTSPRHLIQQIITFFSRKLEHLGMVFHWYGVEAFLDREQHVVYDDTSSSRKTITCTLSIHSGSIVISVVYPWSVKSFWCLISIRVWFIFVSPWKMFWKTNCTNE